MSIKTAQPHKEPISSETQYAIRGAVKVKKHCVNLGLATKLIELIGGEAVFLQEYKDAANGDYYSLPPLDRITNRMAFFEENKSDLIDYAKAKGEGEATLYIKNLYHPSVDASVDCIAQVLFMNKEDTPLDLKGYHISVSRMIVVDAFRNLCEGFDNFLVMNKAIDNFFDGKPV